MVDLAVTGATGLLGGCVSRLLDQGGVDHLAVARDPARLPQRPHLRPAGPAAYDDATFGNALAGVETLLLVSASLSGRRLAEHTVAIEAAVTAGVSRIVYVSLLGAAPDATYINSRDHWQTEQVLAECGLRWTVVRPSYYTSTLARLTDDEGVVRGPAPTGRVSLVTHEDIAEVIVGIMRERSDRYDDTILPVKGPHSLPLAEAADRLAASSGEVQRFEPITAQECRRMRSIAGEPPDRAESWVSWFQSVEAGEVAEVSDAVKTVAGHGARTVEGVMSDR
jgi:NAD(P)H dehydrogenase (quinone)